MRIAVVNTSQQMEIGAEIGVRCRSIMCLGLRAEALMRRRTCGSSVRSIIVRNGKKPTQSRRVNFLGEAVKLQMALWCGAGDRIYEKVRYQRFLPSMTSTGWVAASKLSKRRALTLNFRVLPSQAPSGWKSGVSL